MTAEDIAKELLAQRVELTGYVRALVVDSAEAEDIFQETAVKAVGHAADFAESTHLRRWFIRCAKNAALDRLRRSHRQPCRLPEGALEALAADEEASRPLAWRERLGALRACLATLTPRAREIVELRYAAELSGPAIAQRLDRQPDSIHKSLSRTYQHLRECIRRREATGGTASHD